MSEHETHAYDHCPRCKSGQIEATRLMYGENKWAVEHLTCYNCGLEFEQHYQYVSTVGEWDDDTDKDLLEARENAYRRHGCQGIPTAHIYD